MSKRYQDSLDSSSDVTILGIGNLLMRDEGVGIHAMNQLQASYTFSPEINFVDGGTIGIDLIPYFEDCKKMIIVDAVDSQESPGYIVTLENQEINYRFNTKLSLHHAGLSDVLSIIKLQEIEAPDMILIGVQPERVEMGIELSDTVNEVMPKVRDIALRILKDWNIIYKKITK